MADAFALTEALDREPRSAVIVGAGYIGLEMAEALRARGLIVTMVEQLPQVLPTVDADLARLVADELDRRGVVVHTGTAVTAIESTGTKLAVVGHATNDSTQRFRATADLVLVVVGVRPDTALAETAGVRLGVREAIAVDRRMRTGVDRVFAAGDCVVTYHRLLDTDAYLPLGTTAHKQGRVAGENAVGGDREFTGAQLVGHRDTAVAKRVDGLRHRDPPGHDRRRHRRPRPVLHAAAGQPVGRRPGRDTELEPGPPNELTSPG
jgi:NADPH-dependent 2,4-dienoyl-CoA reductase/sulfur reductase-like enzyme